MIWLFVIPVACAFSSWLVIKIFFTILFHPQHPKKIFGVTIHGILPAKQSSIAEETGKAVASEFLSHNLIEQKVTDPSQVKKIMPLIEEHIDDFLRNKLKKEMPMVGMLIGEKTIGSLKKVFLTELESMFPKVVGGFASNIVAELKIEQLVAQKINSLSLNELESSFRKKYSRQIQIAMMLAALTGLLIGLIGMATVYLFK